MSATDAKTQNDPEQERLMEEEVLLLDMEDNVIGTASKRESHLNESIKKGMLHRAFSVFLFNSDGKLLLQQRAGAKITFPLRWTNTCCSHPLNIDGETEEKDSLGVKRAAIRKLDHELGIKTDTFKLDELKFLTRIYYKAESDTTIWGEHEIDHVLFAQKDVEFEINKNEIEATRYVDQAELKELFEKRKTDDTLLISPWFEMICNRFLFPWWDRLDEIMADKATLEERTKIHALELA
jgi:isopentenyl-diphosphate Delta-isomerase